MNDIALPIGRLTSVLFCHALRHDGAVHVQLLHEAADRHRPCHFDTDIDCSQSAETQCLETTLPVVLTQPARSVSHEIVSSLPSRVSEPLKAEDPRLDDGQAVTPRGIVNARILQVVTEQVARLLDCRVYCRLEFLLKQCVQHAVGCHEVLNVGANAVSAILLGIESSVPFLKQMCSLLGC